MAPGLWVGSVFAEGGACVAVVSAVISFFKKQSAVSTQAFSQSNILFKKTIGNQQENLTTDTTDWFDSRTSRLFAPHRFCLC
jgi:hypothetical protein